MSCSLLSPRTAFAALVAASLSLSACSTDSSTAPEETAGEETTAQETTAADAPATIHDQGLPIDATPDIEATRAAFDPCPYLDGAWLENANGQKLTNHGVDNRFDTPACVFWSFEDVPQAVVTVRTMATDEEATAVVDCAAPIDTTDPADLPGGWMGGRSGNEEGAVFAVQKDNIAVVVRSAQQQSVKAETIAEEVIKNLQL